MFSVYPIAPRSNRTPLDTCPRGLRYNSRSQQANMQRYEIDTILKTGSVIRTIGGWAAVKYPARARIAWMRRRQPQRTTRYQPLCPARSAYSKADALDACRVTGRDSIG